MGRCRFVVRSWGMDEQEALENARENDRNENGYQDGYNGSILCAVGPIKSKMLRKPKVAKRCRIDRLKKHGAVKWITAYEIRPSWPNIDSNVKPDVMIRCTMADAIARAKKLSLERGMSHEVLLKKVIDNHGSPMGFLTVAEVVPKKCEQGLWEFSGEARE